MFKDHQTKMSFELNWDNPLILAKQAMEGFEQNKFKATEFAVILSEHEQCTSNLTLGITHLVNSLLQQANYLQKQNAQNLALGLQQSLAVLQEMSKYLTSDEARIRFAEIIASMSKDYFETVKVLDQSNNNFWRYAIGTIATVSVLWLTASHNFPKTDGVKGN